MASCECGCGQKSASEFQTGQDQKLRIKLESRLGGILQLRALVDAAGSYASGEFSDGEFTQRVRSLFTAAADRRGK